MIQISNLFARGKPLLFSFFPSSFLLPGNDFLPDLFLLPANDFYQVHSRMFDFLFFSGIDCNHRTVPKPNK